MVYFISTLRLFSRTVTTLCFALFLSSVFFNVARAENAISPKKILLITSKGAEHDWTRNLLDEFENYFKKTPYPVEIETLELSALKNCRTFPQNESIDYAIELAAAKNPDAVFIGDYQAAYYLNQYRNECILGIPTVICGLTEYTAETLKDYPNVTLIIEEFDILANAELGLKLFPDTKTIFVLTESSLMGESFEADFRQKLKDFEKAEIIYINGSDMRTEDMLAQIKSTPQEKFVLFAGWNNPDMKSQMSQYSILRSISMGLQCPILTPFDLKRPYILGGLMKDGKVCGNFAAEKINLIFSGKKSEPLIIHSAVVPIFNWAHASKLKFEKADFPSGSIFYNEQMPLLDARNFFILAVVSLCASAAVTLMFFIWKYRLLKKNKVIFDNLPVRITVIDRNKKILFSHAGIDEKLPEDFSKFPPALQKLYTDSALRLSRDKKRIQKEYSWNGERFRSFIQALPNEDFGKDAILIVSTNISALHNAKMENQKIAEQLKTTINSIADGVIATDKNGVVVIFNIISQKILGVSEQEAIGQKIENIFVLKNEAGAYSECPMIKAVNKNKTIEANDIELVSKNGAHYIISLSASPIKDPDDRAMGAILVFRDITEDRKKQDDVISKNILLQTATEVADIAYFHYTDTFDKSEPISGFDNSRFWGNENGKKISVEKWICEEDRRKFYGEWKRLVSGKADQIDITYCSAYYGTKRYFRMSVIKKASKNGQNEYFGIIQEITNLKDGEFKLQDTKNLLMSILDNIPCAIFIKNLSEGGKYVITNKQYREFMHINQGAEFCVDKTDYDFSPKDDAEKFIADDIRLAKKPGKLYDIIEDVQMPDGSIRKSHTIKTTMSTVSGDVYLIGLSLDVTDLMRSEERARAYAAQESVVNECLRIALGNGDSYEIVNSILGTIGASLNADRSYIFKINPDGTCQNTYEWCSKGIGNKQKIPKISAEVSELWIERFNESRLIISENLSTDESPEFKKIKPALEARNIKSLLFAGIKINESLNGFLGVDFVQTHRTFTDIDKNMLKAATNIFELYWARNKAINTIIKEKAINDMILNSIKIPVLLFDANAALVSVNSAAANIINKTKNKILSESCHKNYCNWHGGGPHPNCPIRRTIKDFKSHSLDIEIKGRRFFIVSEPVFDGGGRLKNVVKSCIDMTDFYNAIDAAKSAERAKSEFLATMSHEIRTPLNAIIGLSDILKYDPNVPASSAENINSINVAGKALLSIINDVLEFSKIEADKQKIEYDWLSPESIFGELEKIFKPLADEKKICLNIHESQLPDIFISGPHLRQILLNLIGNALKFTLKGGIDVFGIVHSKESSDDFCDFELVVKDTGCGIPKDDLDKIFNPFEQSMSERRYKHGIEGTGLGLAIVSRLAEKMNGKISVSSEVDLGSEFRVKFMNVRCRPHSNDEISEKPVGALDISKIKIWVLDDIELNCKVLSMMLEKLGAKSESMTSASTLLKRIEQGDIPDIILTDMWMPEMSGMEFARKLRAMENGKHIPVIAVTADTEAGKNFSMDIFSKILMKPISLEKLEQIFSDGIPSFNN